MAWYAVSTVPLIKHLDGSLTNTSEPEESSVKQAWYADDATASGKIEDIHAFWNELVRVGPGFGYFPNE